MGVLPCVGVVVLARGGCGVAAGAGGGGEGGGEFVKTLPRWGVGCVGSSCCCHGFG